LGLLVAVTAALAGPVAALEEAQTTLYLHPAALEPFGVFVASDEVSLSVDTAGLQQPRAFATLDAAVAGPIRHSDTITFTTPGGPVSVPVVIAGAPLPASDPDYAHLLIGMKDANVDYAAGLAQVRADSLTISDGLAATLGNPALAGTAIGGSFTTLRLAGGPVADGGSVIPEDDTLDPEFLLTPCGGSNGPDVIVGDLSDMGNFSSISGIEAFSVGTVSCNMGNQVLLWVASSTNHPVIGQNMYRLKTDADGVSRMELIGISWLKHGFAALTGNVCCSCQNPGNGQLLGIGCSDPYGSGLNGGQGGLGPRFQVNAHTGAFAWPFMFSGTGGNSIYKRLQVKIADLDPALSGGGTYFVEGHYVTPDDAAAFNQDNNVSHRRVTISGSGASWSASMSGSTQRERPAIQAWKENVPSVKESEISFIEADSNKSRGIISANVVQLPDGYYSYEYAVYNMNSDRSVGSFAVPVPASATVRNIGFHDVDYHSGDGFGSTTGNPINYDGTDWPGAFANGEVRWETVDDFTTNPNGNAIRWGTMYNFRFETNRPPVIGRATVGMFKPGIPASVQPGTYVPENLTIVCGDADSDGDVDLADVAVFGQCFGGANLPPDPNCPPGANLDCDADGDVDLSDFAIVSQNFTGSL
jgi:hypothetical protein